jgi:hypothetical protein
MSYTPAQFSNCAAASVQARFDTVVEKGKGLHQAPNNLAAIHTNGSPVVPDKIVAPYRLIFRPTAQVTAASDPTIDFRDDLAQNIKTGTPIYEIFALTEAQETELNSKGVKEIEALLPHGHKIGIVTTEAEFIASQYGDYRLFFRHNDRFIRDEYRKRTS